MARYSNPMVAHIWAQGREGYGQSNNGQFYFEGPTLYSYGRHFVAGYILPLPGGRVFLLNDDSPSITTTRHIGYAHSAAPGRVQYVPELTRWVAALPHLRTAKDVRAHMGLIGFPGLDAARTLFQYVGERDPGKAARVQADKEERRAAKEKAAKEKAARDRMAESAKARAAEPDAHFRDTISGLLTDWNAEGRIAEFGRELNREAKEAKARGWTRIAEKVRARYRQTREVLKGVEARSAAAKRRRVLRSDIRQFRQILASLATMREREDETGRTAASASRLAQLCRQAAALADGFVRFDLIPEATQRHLATLGRELEGTRESLQAEVDRLRHEEQAEERASWHAGENVRGHRSLHHLTDGRGGALLRAANVERDDSGRITGGTLETSQGAEVPLVHAVRVLRFLKRCRVTGESWKTNGRTLRVGHFRVDSVEPSGDFVAGCHRINWPEVERLASELGLAGLAPEDTRESV